MKPRTGRNPESGYALLLIFAMAAIVAITLYSEVPRVAFEAQRDKEQLLVDRGQQYSRAIALFVHKFQRFPATMDELENTNGQRFLRKRYTDPMTGKADWRILHAGPGGVITDSIMNAKKTDGQSPDDGFITRLNLFGNTPSGNAEGVNLATRQRPSDQSGAAGAIGVGNPGAEPAALSPASNGPIPGYSGPVMVLPDGRIVPANTSGTAPQPVGASGGQQGVPPFPGAPPGAQLPNGVAIQQNGQNMPPGMQGPPNAAAGLINQILTTPRPGGINGLPGGPQTVGGAIGGGPQTAGPQNGGPLTAAPQNFGTQTAAPQQNVIGAGIAGVASKKEQEGIKIVNDHTKYNEWEFIYDIAKDPTRQGQNGAPGGTGPGGRGPGPQPPQGMPGIPTPSPTGRGR